MKLTAEHIKQIKREVMYMDGNEICGMPCDMAREAVVGCEHWTSSTYNDDGYVDGSVDLCRWPNGRGAVCYGGDSYWGDWDGDVLFLDDGTMINEAGEEIEAE